MTVRIHIGVNDGDLPAKFDAAERLVKAKARTGTAQVADKGKELAIGFAPVDTGQLKAFIDRQWWGGLRARVYVRRGGFLTHDNRPMGPTGRGHHGGHGYGYWQEVGAYGGSVHNPFMEPAAEVLNHNLAADVMDGFVWAALEESGLEASFGLIGL